MDKYIGIDAHATSCTIVVIGPSGRKLEEHVVETNASALVGCIQSIPRPRHLCLEEGLQSAWLHQVLSPHVDELVVVGLTDKRKDQKSDRRDALARAQQLRLGTFEKIVFKAPDRCAQDKRTALSLRRGGRSPSQLVSGGAGRRRGACCGRRQGHDEQAIGGDRGRHAGGCAELGAEFACAAKRTQRAQRAQRGECVARAVRAS